MNDLAPILQQARAFIEHNVPVEMLQRTVALSILALIIGIGLSVLGAKMAKPALTTALALVGGVFGVAFAQLAGYSGMPGPVVGGAVGAVMFGIVGALTFRIWVGVVTAVVLSSIALGAFGYDRVIPHVAEFDGMVTWPTVTGASEFSVPSPQQQQVYRDRSPRQWAEEFWAFATGKDASLAVNGKLICLGALAAGLFLGVIAMRWMLILSTSVLGTVLVASSVATMITHSVPDAYQTILGHPGVVGMGVGGFLVTSLILQTLLTRKAPSTSEQSNAKS